MFYSFVPLVDNFRIFAGAEINRELKRVDKYCDVFFLKIVYIKMNRENTFDKTVSSRVWLYMHENIKNERMGDKIRNFFLFLNYLYPRITSIIPQ